MKATLFLSSIFFLLGLKISTLIDLRGKANAVDQIITNQILKSKSLIALPLFQDAEEKTTIKENSKPEELQNTEKDTQITQE